MRQLLVFICAFARHSRIEPPVLTLLVLVSLLGGAVARAETAPAPTTESAAVPPGEARAVVEEGADVGWSGYWRTFWRGGQALMTLSQTGDRVIGTYQPDEGEIEAAVDGVTLTGTWSQPGADGAFVFALAPDGESFVGRFDNGEYWNGERIESGDYAATPFQSQATPQDAFRALVAAANATADGDSGANLLLRQMLHYAGETSDTRERNQRRILFLRLLDMSTFRVFDAPTRGEDGRALFAVGPTGTDWEFAVAFVEQEQLRWRVVVPPMADLRATMRAALEALELPSYEALVASRAHSPRQVMRDFMLGTAAWDEGGRERALATLDLSAIHEKLRAVEGPLAADYLRQILSRLGYVIWQEIPDDPHQRLPYIHYEHAHGDIAIGREELENGAVQWRFTSDTVAAVDEIYAGIQNMPLAVGMTPPEPLTSYFRLRSMLQDVSPVLLRRTVLLENWQWLGLGAVLLAALVVSWAAAFVFGLALVGLLRLLRIDRETRGLAAAAFGWPAGLFGAGVVFLVAVRELGLREDVARLVGGMAAVMLIVGGTYFVFRVVDAIGSWLAHRASQTETRVDSIAVAIGTGVAKVAVVVGGVVAAAEVLGLPYEGVIAGLGVGGLALAIAARDSVSNFIGAGILLADRPFSRGDRVQIGDTVGHIEEVGLRSTRIRTLDDGVLVVPNSKLADDTVQNLALQRITHVVLDIGVAQDTPRAKLDAFVSALRPLFLRQPLGSDKDLLIGLNGVGPSALEVRIDGYVRTADDAAFIDAKHSLVADIVDLARDLDVSFAQPTRTVQLVTAPPAWPGDLGLAGDVTGRERSAGRPSAA